MTLDTAGAWRRSLLIHTHSRLHGIGGLIDEIYLATQTHLNVYSAVGPSMESPQSASLQMIADRRDHSHNRLIAA